MTYLALLLIVVLLIAIVVTGFIGLASALVLSGAVLNRSDYYVWRLIVMVLVAIALIPLELLVLIHVAGPMLARSLA